MDKKYLTLFKELTQMVANSAEMVMDYNHKNGKEDEANTAMVMRDDYQELNSRITDDYQLTKADAAKLLIGAVVATNQLEGQIETRKKALAGYQTDLMPKLQAVVDAESDEIAAKIANEKFIIQEN